MTLKRRLNGIIEGTDANGLLMKAGLSTFPNARALNTFFEQAGITPSEEREALNTLVTMASATLSSNPWFRASLASFFRLTLAHRKEDRHERVALAGAYREYLVLKDRAEEAFAQFEAGTLFADEVREISRLARHLPTEYLHALDLPQLQEDDSTLLQNFIQNNLFNIVHAHTDGVPAQMFMVLCGVADGKGMKYLAAEGIPAEEAHGYLSAGISPEETVRFWREGIPVEYAATL
jgi:hypothetical protein